MCCCYCYCYCYNSYNMTGRVLLVLMDVVVATELLSLLPWSQVPGEAGQCTTISSPSCLNRKYTQP